MRTSTGSLQSFGHFIDMSGKPASDRGKSPYKHLFVLAASLAHLARTNFN